MKNQKGFIASGTLLASAAILVIAATGLYIWRTGQTKEPAENLAGLNQDSSGSSSFSGKVVFDQCAIAHDAGAGCSIVIGNKSVQIVQANIAAPDDWGKLEGFGALQDITGEQVQVRANRIGPNTYDLAGRQYYVKLLK